MTCISMASPTGRGRTTSETAAHFTVRKNGEFIGVIGAEQAHVPLARHRHD